MTQQDSATPAEQSDKGRGRPKIEVSHNLMKLICFLVLAIVAVVTLVTHQDPATVKYVLSGCVTLAIIAMFCL